MNSIRTHLTLWLLVGSGVLFVAGGLLAYRVVHSALQAEFDYSLRTKVHDLATLTEWDHGRYELEFVEKPMPEFGRSEHPEYFMVQLRDGEMLARSPSLGSAVLALPARIPLEQPVSYALKLPGGMPGRAAAVAVALNGKVLDIVVARDTVRLNHLFHSLAVGFAGTTLLFLLALAFGVKVLVHKGLRPLDVFAGQVVAVDSANLDHRFSSSALPEELRPIAVQLDQLLERIETAFQRERYLTGAMAHELYTPIAELRSLTEVALKWPDDSEASASVVEQAHDIARQMQDLVNALLSLSRCEAGLQKVEFEPVDVAELLDSTCRSYGNSFREKRIAITKSWKPGVVLETDRAMLAAILDNLFRNAAEYTPEGGVLDCLAETTGGGCTVTFTNTQDTLSEADLKHLFEPLWRKDQARTGTSHSGLGLALVDRFCTLLGIRVSAALTTPGRFRIALTVPGREHTNLGDLP